MRRQRYSASMIERFPIIADRMNSLVFNDRAELHYDMLADALWWSDERPHFNEPEDHACLQRVFRYRTSLILDRPELEDESYWIAAQRDFPDWPGFHPSRCQPNGELVRFFHECHRKAMHSLENIPDSWPD